MDKHKLVSILSLLKLSFLPVITKLSNKIVNKLRITQTFPRNSHFFQQKQCF